MGGLIVTKATGTLTILCALLAMNIGAGAATIIVDTWGGSEGWQAGTTFGLPGTSLTPGASLGGQTGLGISGGQAGQASESAIFTSPGDGGNDFTGNYTDGSMGGVVEDVNFQFYAESTPPAALQLYFVSGGVTWYYSINVGTGWNSYSIPLMDPNDDPGGWNSVGHLAADFLNDLATVDEIGIILTYAPGTGQNFGLDNFELNDGDYLFLSQAHMPLWA